MVTCARAVLFDLYETLITEFDPNWRPGAPIVAEQLGLPAGDQAASVPYPQLSFPTDLLRAVGAADG